MSIPDCATTTFDGCDLLEGSYAGDGRICINGAPIPATSTWGLIVLALLIAGCATLLLHARRRASGSTIA